MQQVHVLSSPSPSHQNHSEHCTSLELHMWGLHLNGVCRQHRDLRSCLLDKLLEIDLSQLLCQLLQFLFPVLPGKRKYLLSSSKQKAAFQDCLQLGNM